ncbi:ATP-dependent helicase HrpB [Shewanella psychromarinicola]|uniref:ATP-dependent helicase HrpB n=1 Tax=Shewanella psychromarinicola TaxID=2487742 RepID=UPI001F17177B|nr:ATP-dependent helicase HrpB [Shewanella psychromarinicola]MCL1080618.1 ATP-dependent helicase HrpB [Shewanella psychromarinicola]
MTSKQALLHPKPLASTTLPIQAVLEPLRVQFATHSQIILEAPTGAGKSTALPLAMLAWPEIRGKILMLEPRRVAARNVAKFIAQQLGQAVGQAVGYRVRGESKVSSHTRLEIVTEGILTRMIQHDPELSGIDVIIFDEIHERHLATDLGLALALEVQQSLRDDLHIIAMSATLSGLPLDTLMPNAAQIHSDGRSFAVEIAYQPCPSQQLWLTHMSRVIINTIESTQLAAYQQGSILAFLPGKGEIRKLAGLLRQRLDGSWLICPMYGDLSSAEQDQAIRAAEPGKRKIVLATNVAESSLTIEGITLVIDSGYRREASFNPKTGVTRLGLRRISQASAIQRSGRAGRLAVGYCVRLWSQEEQGRMRKVDEPEISQAELTSMALDCASWGVTSFAELSLLTPPPPIHEQVAWQLLQQLELIDPQRKLTSLGRDAYALGCHPRLAHMLLKAKQLARHNDQPQLCLLACVLAGIIEARGLPKKGADIHHYLTETLQGQIKQQVRQWQQSLSISGQVSDVIRNASTRDISYLLALAYPDRIAKARGHEGFLLSNGTGVVISADDSLAHEPWLVVADFQETQGRNAGQVYLAARLDERLFTAELASLVTTHIQGGWDNAKGRFFAEKHTKIGEVIIKTDTGITPARAQITAALLAQIRIKGLTILNRDEVLIQLQYRVELARHYAPEHEWPCLSDEYLLATLEDWLGPYLDNVSSLTALAKVGAYGLVKNLLNWQQQQLLEQLVPTHWPMATGTRAPIRYQMPLDADGHFYHNHEQQGRALLSVRLQEALGLAQSPLILHGKMTVTMELLSPAQRPLAVTADLASFWQGPYVDVKKEMRGRYPRHLWPDDPVNTVATKFTKKKTPGV